MADWNIAPPPLTHPNIVNAMRTAPPVEPFNEAAALARMQRVTFLRTIHERGPVADPALRAEWAAHQQKVAAYSQVKAPPPTLAPLPAATVPRTPRLTLPAPVQPTPTPALAGVTRRAEMLISLLGARPAAAPTDKTPRLTKFGAW